MLALLTPNLIIPTQTWDSHCTASESHYTLALLKFDHKASFLGCSGEENVSVIVAPLFEGFKLEAMGAPEFVAQQFLSTVRIVYLRIVDSIVISIVKVFTAV